MSLDARLSPEVDLEHPWLGLESFSEITRSYFFGRDVEAAELLQRLRLHPLLVLYGRCGLGKTSLLRARLVPDLEKLGARPAFYRISYRKGEDSPLAQIAVALGSWERIDQLGIVLPSDPASRLWLNFHHRERENGITHLILDQFEEIFTLGAEWPGADAEVRQALAIFVQGATPPSVETLLDEGEAFLKHFHLDVPPLPVLLSVRQDYVFALNRWRSHLRQLGENHYELRALRGPAAFDAVFKPGELRCHYRGEVSEETKADTGLPPIVSEEAARRIVHFVAEEKEDVPLEEIEAVPPILSLLCRELNERRFTEHVDTAEKSAAKITFHEDETDIETNIETIIATFYERCLEGRPEAVRIFIEEELVSRYSGARLQQDERSILKVFADGFAIPGAADDRRAAGYGDTGRARACLEGLVNQRLLTAIGGGENPSYELIHDLLAAVVQKNRTAREERFLADRRAVADRKAKEDAEANAREAADRTAVLDAALKKETQSRKDADLAIRRTRRLAVSLIAAFAAVALIVALAAQAEKERQSVAAQQAKERAVASKRAADELIIFMQYDLRESLGKLGHLDMMDAINSRILKYQKDHPPEEGDLDALREKAEALGQQGDLRLAEGRLKDAFDEHRLALQIFEELLAKKPDSTDYQREISLSYENVGDVQRAQGDLAGALKSYHDGLGIAEKLAKQDPGNADWQRDLSVSYGNVGNVLSAQGELAGALKSYRESLGIAEKLAKQDPGNADWQRDLSVSYGNVGNVLSAQGDLAGALTSYREGLGIAEKLAKRDPGNALWHRDLSISYSNVGNLQRAQGDLAGALKSYRESLGIAEKLAKHDPGNVDWQRDLSVSYYNVGDLQRAQGDLAGTLKSYRESLGIREKLAKQDPSNALWQCDLALVYWKTGSVWALVEPKSRNEARATVERGRDILRQMKEHMGLTAVHQEWLNSIEADLRKMQKKK